MAGNEPLTRPEQEEPGQGLDPEEEQETTISEPVPQPKTRRPERR